MKIEIQFIISIEREQFTEEDAKNYINDISNEISITSIKSKTSKNVLKIKVESNFDKLLKSIRIKNEIIKKTNIEDKKENKIEETKIETGIKIIKNEDINSSLLDQIQFLNNKIIELDNFNTILENKNKMLSHSLESVANMNQSLMDGNISKRDSIKKHQTLINVLEKTFNYQELSANLSNAIIEEKKLNEQQMQILKKETNQAKSALIRIQEENQILQKELADKDTLSNHIELAKLENEKIKMYYENKFTELKNNNENQKKIEKKYQKLNEKFANAKSIIKELQNVNAEIQSKQQKSLENCLIIEKENSDLSKKIKSQIELIDKNILLEKNLKEANIKIEELNSKAEFYQEKILSYEKFLISTEKENKLILLKLQIEQEPTKIKSKTGTNLENETKSIELNELITNINKDLSQYMNQIKQLFLTISQKDELINKYTQEERKLKDENESLRSEKLTMKDSLLSMQDQKEELKVKIEGDEKLIKSFKKSIKQNDETITSLNEAINDKTKSIEVLKVQLNNLNEKINSFQSDSDIKQKVIDDFARISIVNSYTNISLLHQKKVREKSEELINQLEIINEFVNVFLKQIESQINNKISNFDILNSVKEKIQPGSSKKVLISALKGIDCTLFPFIHFDKVNDKNYLEMANLILEYASYKLSKTNHYKERIAHINSINNYFKELVQQNEKLIREL